MSNIYIYIIFLKTFTSILTSFVSEFVMVVRKEIYIYIYIYRITDISETPCSLDWIDP